jgi:hypothetical protein
MKKGTLFVIRRMKMKAMVEFHVVPNRMAKSKQLENTKCSKEVGNWNEW